MADASIGLDTLPQRNSTSFPKLLQDVLKHIPKEAKDALKYHQRVAVEYLMKYPHVRGLLAYQQMGAGKSRIAVACCEWVIKNDPDKKIIFIASKSLHGNFVNEIKLYLADLAKAQDTAPLSEAEIDKHIAQHYEFVTLTAGNMLEQVYRTKSPEEGDLFSEAFDELDEKVQKKKKLEMDYISKLGNLDDTFVIIDEAHIFFNSVTNGSKNAVGLYHLLMNAQRIKILMMTGSPITNDPYEIAIAFNIAQGYMKEPGMNTKTTLFGEDYEDFIRYFVHRADTLDLDSSSMETKDIPSIQRRDKFSNRAFGLLSYYGTDRAEIRKLFPTQLDMIVRRVPMSTPQYAAYSAARDREMEESKRGMFKGKKKPLQKPAGGSSSYRVRSRQFSNFLYPKTASRTFKDEKGYTRYEKYIDKVVGEVFNVHPVAAISKKNKAKSDKVEEVDESGWGLEIYSPKLIQMLVDISQHLPAGILKEFHDMTGPADNEETLKDRKKRHKDGKIVMGPGIVYSQFIDSGIGILAKSLEHYGFRAIQGLEDITKVAKSPKGSYAIISGEVDPELRSELLRIFNSPENRHGEVVTLLLITSTGAEGLNCKGVTHEHIMEPYWHWSRIAQVLARGVRLNSHIHLPEKDRIVQPYMYLSDYPLTFEDKEQAKIKTVEDTTDVTLYLKALQNQVLINSFLVTMQESSLDCALHYGLSETKGDTKDARVAQIKCKMCSPTGESLFLPDLDKDMLVPSHCQTLQESKVVAQTVILEGKDTGCADCPSREYKFYQDSKGELHIVEFNERLKGYQEIFADHPDYYTLKSKIEKRLGKKTTKPSKKS